MALQGSSQGALLPPHPIALRGHSTGPMPRGALAQLLLPWGSSGTAPLFPRGPQHSSLCPWVSTGKTPCVQGESWHSFLCPCLSTGTAPSALGSIGTASALKEP